MDFAEKQKQFDYHQFVVPDLRGVARGRIVKGKFKEKTAHQGFEISTGQWSVDLIWFTAIIKILDNVFSSNLSFRRIFILENSIVICRYLYFGVLG
jgi:hypothetical protein